MIPIRSRPSRPASSAYDRIAPLYDDDMGRNNPGRDIAFYVARCRGVSSILELGCGTGRITLPLVQSGADVTALDRSRPMLEELRRKCRVLPGTAARRVRLYWSDMRDGWRFERPFASVLCPFSTFTYVTTGRARERVLGNIRRHLAPGGLFLLDLFVPRPEVLRLPAERVLHDYRRCLTDGTFLEREKTIATDAARQIQIVHRTYRRMDGQGNVLECFTTRSRIRYLFPDEMRRLLEANSFEIVEESGDFEEQSICGESRTAAWLCRPT